MPPSLAKPADLTDKVARTKRIKHPRIKAICPDMERANRAAHIRNVLATCPRNAQDARFRHQISINFPTVFEIFLTAKPARVAAKLLEVVNAA